MENISIRNTAPSDYEDVISVMPEWWNGRDLTSSIPKVFFIHFCNTSFVIEKDNKLIGFLIGFLSQSNEKSGFIHFVGVHPEHRKNGVGRILYQQFFDICKAKNRFIVTSCTSPVNKLSIAFHQRMGFIIESGDSVVDGYPVTMNYLGYNEPLVLFEKQL
jgi:predicted GNAT superfamily acetyltransferase